MVCPSFIGALSIFSCLIIGTTWNPALGQINRFGLMIMAPLREAKEENKTESRIPLLWFDNHLLHSLTFGNKELRDYLAYTPRSEPHAWSCRWNWPACRSCSCDGTRTWSSRLVTYCTVLRWDTLPRDSLHQPGKEIRPIFYCWIQNEMCSMI